MGMISVSNEISRFFNQLSKDDEVMGALIGLIGASIGILVVIWGAVAVVKASEHSYNASQPIKTIQATIISVERSNGYICAYLFECADGTRVKLKPHGNGQCTFIEGDCGILQYQGRNLQGFSIAPDKHSGGENG